MPAEAAAGAAARRRAPPSAAGRQHVAAVFAALPRHPVRFPSGTFSLRRSTLAAWWVLASRLDVPGDALNEIVRCLHPLDWWQFINDCRLYQWRKRRNALDRQISEVAQEWADEVVTKLYMKNVLETAKTGNKETFTSTAYVGPCFRRVSLDRPARRSLWFAHVSDELIEKAKESFGKAGFVQPFIELSLECDEQDEQLRNDDRDFDKNEFEFTLVAIAKLGGDRSCASCKKLESELGRRFQRCAGCKSVQYCGKDCQVQDWPQHKQRCVELR